MWLSRHRNVKFAMGSMVMVDVLFYLTLVFLSDVLQSILVS
jgi:hypothetical protein